MPDLDPTQPLPGAGDQLKQMVADLGRGTGAPESTPLKPGSPAEPRPGTTPKANLPLGGDSERIGASAARGLGEPSTPGAGGSSGPEPLRRFPGVMQGDQAGSPFLRRAIGAPAAPSGGSPPTKPAVQLMPTPPSGSPKPVINLPKGAGQVPATATLFLFVGLALVVMWKNTVRPLVKRATTGTPEPVTMPSSAMLSLLLFGVILVFISELGPTEASFTALLLFGLWAVFLVMNPQVVQTFASWVSQGNKQAATAKQSQTSHASTKGA